MIDRLQKILKSWFKIFIFV